MYVLNAGVDKPAEGWDRIGKDMQSSMISMQKVVGVTPNFH